MEKSLPSGTNMNTLKKEWEEFCLIPFPDLPEDDYLHELYAELDQIDTHIAGIVTSFMHRHKVDKKLIYIDDDYNKKLDAYVPTDTKSKNIKTIMKERKSKLDNLTKIVLNLYDS